MSGAVFASLDGETNFATVPERVESRLARRRARRSIDRGQRRNRKADRLPPPGEANAARQVIRVTTTARGSGDREIVRVRPFIRVAGNLSPRCPNSHQHPCLQCAEDHAPGRRGCRQRRRRRAPSPTPRCRSSPATSPAPLPGRRSRRSPPSRRCSHACARPPWTRRRIGARPALLAARSRPCSPPTRPNVTAIPMPASNPASSRKTSPCCPRPRPR